MQRFLNMWRAWRKKKIFGRPEAAARRLTGLVEKNREHWKVYLKRVTPIFGAL